MNCPYCKTEMEEGRILGDRIIGTVWLPSGTKAPLLGVSSINIEERGGLCLADSFSTSLREGCSLTAHICRACGKGIFDLVSLVQTI